MSSPKVGFVSLGCPKALVDSERILTQLRAEGYITVSALSEYGQDEEEALRLDCSFIYKNGNIKALA